MNQVRSAIYRRLSADATLTALLSAPGAVFHQVAPQSASFPLVIFHRQDGRPRWAFAGDPMQWDLWAVKAVDKAWSAIAVEEIAARIDAVLNDAPLEVDGRAVLYVRRESDIDYSEQDGADVYRHCGAMYRLVTEPA